MTHLLIKLASAVAVLYGLTACTAKAPSPAWELEAKSASDRATKAYLRGESKIAQVEWQKAFEEVSATGQPSAMARMALLQCAVQMAALEMTDCARYQRYAAGAEAPEQAYARYLQALHTAADVPFLPVAQQPVAAFVLAGKGSEPLSALPPGPALSQLTAAAVALRAGLIGRAAIQQAGQVAAEQGWRRAVMAWLAVERRLALVAGDDAVARSIELRLQVLAEDQRSQEIKK